MIQQIEMDEKQRQEHLEDAMREIEGAIKRKYQKNELKWINVPSKHDHLKPYLKQKLIEQLQNPDTEIYQ